MFGEHIEEMIALCKENEVPLTVEGITESVLDIAFAQGLIEESELDLAHMQVTAQVEYMLHPSERSRA